MVSKTSICNKALRKIGVAPAMNIDTDDSKQATICKSSYDDVLLEVLRAHNWNFAIFRQALNKDSMSSPAFGFENRFILPTIPQFIRVINIQEDTESAFKDEPNFKIENNFLLSNAKGINLRFVGKETDPNKYDPIFIDCFANRLAWEVSYFLTSDFNVVDRMRSNYIDSLSLAKDKDQQEDNQDPILVSRFNSGRFSDFEVFNKNIDVNA